MLELWDRKRLKFANYLVKEDALFSELIVQDNNNHTLDIFLILNVVSLKQITDDNGC